jgi:acylphosphatase
MHAKQVYYSGHVQGVGFRYTVKRIASGYEVTGWVKNLPDGRVELQVMTQDSRELEEFLEAVRTSSLGGNIRDEEAKELPPLAGVRGFSIVH